MRLEETGRRSRSTVRNRADGKWLDGIGDRFRRKIDAHGGGGYAREIRGSVAGAATQVEDAPPGAKRAANA